MTSPPRVHAREGQLPVFCYTASRKPYEKLPFLATAPSSFLAQHTMALLDGAFSMVLQTAIASLIAFTAYAFSLSLHRLYLSPLAKFPGPRLAALTLWYEFYYDVVKKGRYSWKIAEMHEKYGRAQVLNNLREARCLMSHTQAQ